MKKHLLAIFLILFLFSTSSFANVCRVKPEDMPERLAGRTHCVANREFDSQQFGTVAAGSLSAHRSCLDLVYKREAARQNYAAVMESGTCYINDLNGHDISGGQASSYHSMLDMYKKQSELEASIVGNLNKDIETMRASFRAAKHTMDRQSALLHQQHAAGTATEAGFTQLALEELLQNMERTQKMIEVLHKVRARHDLMLAEATRNGHEIQTRIARIDEATSVPDMDSLPGGARVSESAQELIYDDDSVASELSECFSDEDLNELEAMGAMGDPRLGGLDRVDNTNRADNTTASPTVDDVAVVDDVVMVDGRPYAVEGRDMATALFEEPQDLHSNFIQKLANTCIPCDTGLIDPRAQALSMVLAGLERVGAGEDPVNQAIEAGTDRALEWAEDRYPEQTATVLDGLGEIGSAVNEVVTYVDDRTGNVVSENWNELPEHTRNQIKGAGIVASVVVPVARLSKIRKLGSGPEPPPDAGGAVATRTVDVPDPEHELFLDTIVDHSFEKHVVVQGEFKGLGIRTRAQFRTHVNSVVENPSSVRYSRRGVVYIQESTGTVVWRNPGGRGTMFQPRNWDEYISNLPKRTTPYSGSE